MNPKRILCMLLTAVLLLSLCPVYASADATEHTETEINGSIGNANPITLGEEWTGHLSSKEDKDYYRLTIPEDGYITLSFRHEVCSISASTWTLNFYDEQNIKSAEPYFSYTYNGDNQYTKTSPEIGIAAGTYYIVVEAGNFYSDVSYTFQVNFTQAENYEFLNNNTKASAQEITFTKKLLV